MVASKQVQTVNGRFQYLIFSPRGSIEGVLLEVEKQPTQLVFDRHDETASVNFETLKKGQAVVIRAKRQAASPKGKSEHAVFGYVRLVSIDGRTPLKRKASKGAEFTGVVTRFNYARHGAANGVVLDTGDFIHTKPQGLVGLQLNIGDPVSADGKAKSLAVGTGRVVEAARVNGKRIKP